MSNPLPSPSSLLDGLDALEKQLTAFEAGRLTQRFQKTSADGHSIVAVADGLGRLFSLNLDPALVAGSTAAALGPQVRDVINAALAAAQTSTAAAITTAAAGFAFPGLPAQGKAVPDYSAFPATVSTLTSAILTANPCNTSAVFTCVSGPVTAVVNAHRQIVTLTYASLPDSVDHLETSTIAAVNCAIDKGTDRKDDSSGAGQTIVDRANGLQGLVVYAGGQLLIDDRVAIVPVGGVGFGRIANAGTGQTNIGVEADTGDILSRGPVIVRDRGRVHGAIRTASTLQLGSNTQITGPVTQNAVVVLPDLLVNIGFTGTPKPAVSLEPNTQGSAGPDYYAGITVKTGSTLTLTASGVYRCNNFDIEPGATVILKASAGPIYIYVRDTFIFHGTINDFAGGFPNLFIGYFGSGAIVLESPFRGTIVSPNASMRLATVGPVGHAGAFHGGKDVEVSPDTRVLHQPFAVPYENLPGLIPPPPSRAALFGFEDLSGWTSAQGTLTWVLTPTTQGTFSLQVSGIKGKTEIVSPVFATDGISAPTKKVRVDLWISKNQPKPTAVGQYQLVVNVPSAGVSNVLVGSVPLTPLPRDAWSTLELTMTTAVANALTTAHPDASLKIVLDVTSGSGPYFLDNLRFA